MSIAHIINTRVKQPVREVHHPLIVGSRAVLRHGLAGDKRTFSSINSEHQTQLREYLESQRQHLESKVMSIDALAVRILQALRCFAHK